MITDHHPDDVRAQIAVLRETTYRLSNDSNATHEQHENRIAALETYRMDTNAVEARQDDDPGCAWYVNFYDGGVYSGSKGYGNFVRAVRGPTGEVPHDPA